MATSSLLPAGSIKYEKSTGNTSSLLLYVCQQVCIDEQFKEAAPKMYVHVNLPSKIMFNYLASMENISHTENIVQRLPMCMYMPNNDNNTIYVTYINMLRGKMICSCGMTNQDLSCYKT